MARFTLSIPTKWKEEMEGMPHVNWPEVAKSAVLEKLAQLQKFEKIVRRGDL